VNDQATKSQANSSGGGRLEPRDQPAMAFFLQEVERLPGVLAVEQAGESVKVYVADRSGPVAAQVRLVEDALLERYPDARLDLWVSQSPPPAGAAKIDLAA
jgi:hypothetical protein